MISSNTQVISTYGFCMLVAASLVGIFAMSIDYFVGYVNTVIAPCQHDSPWQDGKCVCDNTKGVFGGEFCEECQCKHLGICRMSAEGVQNTRWSCRCPNHYRRHQPSEQAWHTPQVGELWRAEESSFVCCQRFLVWLWAAVEHEL